MSPVSRAYVTYFDQRYLARALVMLRSLRRHDPQAEIFPLCFDPVAFEVVAGLGDAMITPIGAAEITAFEPRLEEYGKRDRWEFYATHKPVLPLYVFSRQPELGAICHIDADTFFFASPQPLFDEIGQASIALSPHRFSPIYEGLVIYGQFNAGFIYWRRDLIGWRCLDDYRTDCFRWCRARAEPDGRYMNQGYLTSWWRRYPSVHAIRHPGVNLGLLEYRPPCDHRGTPPLGRRRGAHLPSFQQYSSGRARLLALPPSGAGRQSRGDPAGDLPALSRGGRGDRR